MKSNKIKIFVIEDNSALSKMLTETISKSLESSIIYNFDNVEKALGSVNEKPDYIILDHFLKKNNGIDCIPIFREYLADTKIIVLSSQNDIKTFENAFLYGANEYYRKDGLAFHNVVDYIKKDIENSSLNWYDSIIEVFKTPKVQGKKSKLIYVLDDNLTTSFSIEHLLQNETKNTVFSFNKIKDFFSQVEITKPDFVVLDYNLEESLTGCDVLKQLKQISPDTIVIMFSGQTDVITATELLKFGASYYLTKSNENFKKLKTIIN
jgi:DNA-binding NtrC family response regulator